MSAAAPFTPPGAYRKAVDLRGPFDTLVERMPQGSLVLCDLRVAELHPRIAKLAARRASQVLLIRAGERAKTLSQLDRVAKAATALPRSGTLVCIGGGTVGDLGTVAAHLIKRGVSLIQVPSTLLAAVDSSLGGKGAVHSGTGERTVKNALGVFHYATETWLCPELFQTLNAKQLREGAIEAWKMVATLSAPLWTRYRKRPPTLEVLVRDARALKAQVCARDPYELEGYRRVLNFGHTFGHALESLSGFRLSHGDAVGLGMLCALDVGRKLGVTPPELAQEIETGVTEGARVLPRRAMARVLAQARDSDLDAVLAADKKSERAGELRMVLVPKIGAHVVAPVPRNAWRPLLTRWRSGASPR